MTFGDFARKYESIPYNKLKSDFAVLGKAPGELRKMNFFASQFEWNYNDLTITEKELLKIPGIGVKRLKLIYETAEYLGFKVDTDNKDVIISYS